MECWASILTLVFGTTKTAELYTLDALYSQGNTCVFISIRG